MGGAGALVFFVWRLVGGRFGVGFGAGVPGLWPGLRLVSAGLRPVVGSGCLVGSRPGSG